MGIEKVLFVVWLTTHHDLLNSINVILFIVAAVLTYFLFCQLDLQAKDLFALIDDCLHPGQLRFDGLQQFAYPFLANAY